MIERKTTTAAVPTSWYGDILPLEMIEDQLETMLQRQNADIYQYCPCSFCCTTKIKERRRRLRRRDGESVLTHQSRQVALGRMTFPKYRHDQYFEEEDQELNCAANVGGMPSCGVSSLEEQDFFGVPLRALTTARGVCDHRQSIAPQQYDLLNQQQENDYICRKRMCEWSYQIVDSLGFRREIVAIAFNYLDRFAVFQHIFRQITDFVYKLASITALYIALKVHNRTTIKASTLSSLSRGEITVGDIIAMESLMLDTLSYHLCPPTCYTFISLFYAFVPASVRERVGHPLMQHAIYLTELSVMDISFQYVKASHIALAAMLNVMEVMGEEAVPSWARSRFVRDVEECMLKTSLQQQEGNDNEFATAGDRDGEDTITSDEEGAFTSFSHRYAEEESLSHTVLRRCVDRARHSLHVFMSREGYDLDYGTFQSEQILNIPSRSNEIQDHATLVPQETQVDSSVSASDPDTSESMSGSGDESRFSSIRRSSNIIASFSKSDDNR